MMILVVIITAVVLCLLVLVRCDENENQEVKQAVVDANNAFSADLYETLNDECGNILVSPLSVIVVMAMAWLGARDDTAREMAAGLHIPESHIEVEKGFKAMLTNLQSRPTITLDIANKIYLQKGFHVEETYRKSAVDNFRSGIQEVDFCNNTEEARITINQWVERETHYKIRDMIREGTLKQSVLMMAVSAIYFTGAWEKPFDESETVSKPFHLTPNKTIKVPMMHQANHFLFGFVPELDSRVLWLKYRGNNDDRQNEDPTQSMIIILPEEIDGLNTIEDNIAVLNVASLKRKTKIVETNVILPKFKIQKTIPMAEKLKQLGITSAFEMGANFSGITDESIFIDDVLQKTFVEVTEKGTKAAPVRVLEVFLLSAPEYSEQFQATHPFMFLIVDDASDAILFMGRVADPNDEYNFHTTKVTSYNQNFYSKMPFC